VRLSKFFGGGVPLQSGLPSPELPDWLRRRADRPGNTVALKPRAKNLKAQGGVRPAPAISDRRTFRAPVCCIARYESGTSSNVFFQVAQ
jgi:hypothetical protein